MNGYCFTKAEQEEMKRKGYSIKLCSSMAERDNLADEYKGNGYKVRKAYSTTMVRGYYDYYLWIKYEGIKAKPQPKYTNYNKEAEYKRICEKSAKRVLPKIKKMLAFEGIAINEPYIAGAMYNKGRTIGRCYGKRRIFIQAAFLDKAKDEDIDKVMIHEILHCVPKSKGHDKLFKELQRNMNYIMPYKVCEGGKGGIINVSI